MAATVKERGRPSPSKERGRSSPAKRRGRSSVVREPWWDRLSGRTQHVICIGVLFAVAFGFYAPAIFSGRSLIGDDTVRWRAMAEHMLDYEEETGEQAIWAPNAFAGMPGYMIAYDNQVPQLDEVPNLFRAVIWPASHFILLLLGTYCLVIFLTGNRLAGVMAAVAFGLSTYLVFILPAGHNTKFVALCFTPWLVLAFAWVIRKPGLLPAMLLAMMIGLHLRSGHVQITYYVAFLLGVWWVVEMVVAIRKKAWKLALGATAYLVLASVLGLLLVAQPYVPNWEYKAHTIRGAVDSALGGLDWAYAMRWSQGIGELITLVAADAYGGSSPTYWGPKPFTSGPHYVGAIVLCLALMAVWRRPSRVVLAFAVGTLLIVLFSLGSHFALLNRFMFEHFPLFNAFRVPETWLSIGVLGLAVLAAFGLHGLGAERTWKDDRASRLVLGGVAGLLLVLWLFSGAFFDFERPGERSQIERQLLAQEPGASPDDARIDRFMRQQRELRAETFRSEMMRSLVFVLLAGVLVVLFQKGTLPRWWMQAALALLVIVDLWGVGRRYFNQEHVQPSGRSEGRIATYDFDRFLLDRQVASGGPGAFRVLSLETPSPFENARPSYHHESIGGYHGAKLRLIQEYVDHVFIDPNTGFGPTDRALDLLNTRYVVARGTLPGMPVVYRGEQSGLLVLENLDALPRAWLVGDVEVVGSPEEAWALLRDPAFDLRRRALSYEPFEGPLAPIDSASTAHVEMRSYDAHEIVLEVETDGPRLLMVSEVYYPAGWKAFVNGRVAPILRADHLLRAVPVPAGTHEVVLRFRPASHRVGVWLTGTATVLVYGYVLVFLGMGWVRRHRQHVPA